MKFGYWKIRGLMQPIRLMNEYLGVKWEEKLYEAKATPEGKYDYSEWTSEKWELGLDFPNLPYMMDPETGMKLTQSDAILRYIARKYSPAMLGTDLLSQASVNMVAGVLADLKSKMNDVVYGPADMYQTKLGGFKTYATRLMAGALKYMGTRSYIAADYLTYVDFVAYEHFSVTRLMVPDILTETPDMHTTLEQYLTRIENLPGVAEYRKSARFIERPINGESACFR